MPGNLESLGEGSRVKVGVVMGRQGKRAGETPDPNQQPNLFPSCPAPSLTLEAIQSVIKDDVHF